jgi:diguanylate cyclase (GGDEF)-like protein
MAALESPTRRPLEAEHSQRRALLIAGAVILLLGLIFALDSGTGSAPFQHLYYLPIVLAAVGLPRFGGAMTALIAVVLYHFANPVLLAARYRESDLVQIALFLAIGIVTAKLADDRRRLRRLSVTDDLTGLYNLRGFQDLLTRAIRAARATHAPMSMLVLDVDRLKSLNDTHGHNAGADAVRTVGAVIAGHTPPGAFACRFGGDEFVIGLPGQGIDEAEETAQRLRKAVHAVAPQLAGMAFPAATLSVSIGVASQPHFDDGARIFGTDSELGESLFRAADGALYAAKTAGRNQVSANGAELIRLR